MFDFVFHYLLWFFAQPLLCPRMYYLDPKVQKRKLKEPTILVCNHRSHIDGVVVNSLMACNRTIHTLAAKDRFEQKGFGFFLRHTYCIPIDRQHPDTSWLHIALSTLKVKKEHVAIYPEGRHSPDGNILPFHSGVTTLAVMAGVPIVMVYLDGPFKFFKKNKAFIGTPFTIEKPAAGFSAEFVEEQTRMLEEKMRDLQKTYNERKSQTR